MPTISTYVAMSWKIGVYCTGICNVPTIPQVYEELVKTYLNMAPAAGDLSSRRGILPQPVGHISSGEPSDRDARKAYEEK